MNNPSHAPFSVDDKPSALLGALSFDLVSWVRGLSDFEVPEGYEDENGFHHGRVPVRVASRSPVDGPVWMGEDI